MEKTYTQQHIDNFFSTFNALEVSYKIEKVHQLINNPNATAGLRVKYKYKPFKFLIMSVLTIFIAACLLLVGNHDQTATQMQNNVITDSSLCEKNKATIITEQNHKNLNDTFQVEVVSNISSQKEQKNTLNEKALENAINPDSINCSSYLIKKYEDVKIDVVSGTMHISVEGEIVDQQPLESMVLVGNSYNDQEVRDSLENTLFNWQQYVIELSKPELKALGFVFNNGKIQYGWKRGNRKSLITFESDGGYGINMNAKLRDICNNIEPVFLSNTNGMQHLKWKYNGDDNNKWEQQYFKNKIQYLLPVALRKGQYPGLRFDMIFWFEPTEDFLNLLPKQLGADIDEEYKQITQPKAKIKVNPKNQGCTYFEACRSNLELSNLNVYPNPASNLMKIEFEMNKALSGSIFLTSMEGVKVKELYHEVNFNTGLNSFHTDVSDIQNGIYLLYILTADGFKTQRIIITR